MPTAQETHRTPGRPLLKTLPMADPTTHAARRGAVGAVVLAAVLLGAAGTISSLGPDTVRAVDAAAWRTLVGGLGLVAVAGVRRHRSGATGPRVLPRPFVLGTGAVALVVNQLAFFDAIDRIGVAGGTLLTIVTVPIAAGVIDVVSGRPPMRTWLAGVTIGVAGVALLIVPGTATGAPTDPIGVVAALGAGGAAAWWGRSAQVLMQDRPAIEAMAALCGIAAVMFAPLADRGGVPDDHLRRGGDHRVGARTGDDDGRVLALGDRPRGAPTRGGRERNPVGTRGRRAAGDHRGRRTRHPGPGGRGRTRGRRCGARDPTPAGRSSTIAERRATRRAPMTCRPGRRGPATSSGVGRRHGIGDEARLRRV